MAEPAGMRTFFTATLARALELGVAAPEDVLAHATPEVLAIHLPRPVWTRLLAACLGAARTDARLVVDTVGIAVLCEHVPTTILWACVAQLATRALGRGLLAPPPPVAVVATPAPATAPAPVVAAAPVSAPVAAPTAVTVASHSAPIAVVAATPAPSAVVVEPVAEVTRVAPAPAALPAVPARARTADGMARAASEPAPLGEPPMPPRSPGASSRTTLGARRPQAAAVIPARKAEPRQPPPARAATATDFEIETELADAQWKRDPEPVDDDQLIDWSQSEETMTGAENHAHSDRKR